MNNVWSDLTPTQQVDALERLKAGENASSVAEIYNLKISSLKRTARKIRNKEKRFTVLKNNRTIDDNEMFDWFLAGDTTVGSNPNSRVMYINTDKPLTAITYADPHFPYQDRQAVDCFLRALEIIPHDLVIGCGDDLEMDGLSQYGKDPNKIFSKHLEIEKREFIDFGKSVNQASPNSQKFSIFGNHMDRYVRWLYNNPTITWLEEMQIENLLKIKELGWHNFVGEIMFNADPRNLDSPDPELIIHHGTQSRKHAGTSSRVESENLGYVSSVSGHVHRLSVAHKKTLRGVVTICEAGTLRSLRPGYIYRPDWQLGFLVITFVPSIGTYAQPVLIHDGKAYLNGQVI